MRRVEIFATLQNDEHWYWGFETPHGNSPYGMRAIEEEAEGIVERELGDSVKRWFWQFNADAKIAAPSTP